MHPMSAIYAEESGGRIISHSYITTADDYSKMEFCGAPGQLLDQLESIVSEKLMIYGMETNFDYQGGLIGACEQVYEETVQTSLSSSYILPHEIYTLDQDVQSTEEVVNNNLQENFYSCEVCDRRFSVKMNLESHMSVHKNNQLQFCNFCGASFPLKSDLLNHLKIHASFSELEELNNNPDKKSCNLRKSKIIKNCPECNNSFEKSKFDDHICVLNISSDEKSDNELSELSEYNCEKCNKDFKNKTRLTRHLLSHRKKMSCNICSLKFTNQHDLINHYSLHKKTSNGEKIFECKECGKIFASRSSQQIHARVHSGERPYGCNFCDRAFADGGTLRKHERIHTGEKPYVCLICMRAFNQRVVLRDHVKSHHTNIDPKYAGTSKPYFCKICNNLFGTSEEIHKDIVKHCDEETQRRRKPPAGPRKYKKRTFKSQRDENYNSMEEKEQLEGEKKKRGRKSKLEMQLMTEDWKNTVFSKEETSCNNENLIRIFPGGEINRPRTKNVSRPVNDNFRFVPARFPDPKQEFEEISAAVESIKVKMEAYDRADIQEDFGRRTRRRVKEEIY
ncbi:Similar to Znf271: Zinc finger protein 271 (Mus musculus) [Cotesia congregata]|uniref:Similar to Znf271: Zinc finger protein 271 (Mus musculus) n=1 Tax=Cotesia congregata TaxID=51543 RepID=A0A8J2ELX1_COTCN|nr:Similar to Znf271: Zinc finger protein 271 (Mus musculus) [Cotesia congregata]